MPPATAQRIRSTFEADWTVGHITQYDNRIHTVRADGPGPYPTIEAVSDLLMFP